MNLLRHKLFFAFALGFVALSLNACGGSSAKSDADSVVVVPAAEPLKDNTAAGEQAIRFLEDRVRRDPDDFVAYNKLAGLYHGRLRATGNLQYIELFARAAQASLDAVPIEENPGGLSALALSEFEAHDFAAARDHAIKLIEIEPGKGYPYLMLGDALLELGDYEKAADAFRQAQRKNGGSDSVIETRFARLAVLKGDNAKARKHFADALALALDLPVPPRETIAWLRWQLGETAFSIGDYETAEKNYLDTLVTFPDYYRAVASFGRVRAARGDLPGAIEQYEKVVRILPDPTYIAALGDLYKLAGRDEEAKKQYELVEQIGRLSELNGALYNRQMALFYADHDIKTEEAYKLAAKEYEVRRDIYGADALAWTALKAGKLTEAQAAMKDALRLGTRDAKLFYHAGMISDAAADKSAARVFIKQALALNPQFDSLQAAFARKMLESE
jgi:tetratricopeptide (TPR) repeat protein